MSAELDFGQLLRVVLSLSVFLAIAFGGVLAARKYLKSDRLGHRQTKGFTQEGVQKMHTDGQISDDEFKRLQENFIEDLEMT